MYHFQCNSVNKKYNASVRRLMLITTTNIAGTYDLRRPHNRVKTKVRQDKTFLRISPARGRGCVYVLQRFLFFFSSATMVHKYETTVLGNG